jgi:hypothetical protein
LIFESACALFILGASFVVVGMLSGRSVLQIYSLIALSYLHLFPAAAYFLADGRTTDSFLITQFLVFFTFTIPLFVMFSFSKIDVSFVNKDEKKAELKLSLLLPVVTIVLALAFAFVAFKYDLMVRRIGFRALAENTSNVPIVLLVFYRLGVETAFFVLVYLYTCLTTTQKGNSLRTLYMVAFGVHSILFLAFFFVNSRMQFMISVFCLVLVSPYSRKLLGSTKSVARFAAISIVMIFTLTLVREIFLEENYRVSNASFSETIFDILLLVSERVNSVAIINLMIDMNQPLLTFNIAGLEKVFSVYYNFFFDRELYQVIKGSLETSPSQAILIGIFHLAEDDFQKSVILDTFLTFGWPGIVISAVYAGMVGSFCQRQISNPDPTKMKFILAIYLLPTLLEFEKEFLPIIVTVFKWSSMFIVIVALRAEKKFRSSQAINANNRRIL